MLQQCLAGLMSCEFNNCLLAGLMSCASAGLGRTFCYWEVWLLSSLFFNISFRDWGQDIFSGRVACPEGTLETANRFISARHSRCASVEMQI